MVRSRWLVVALVAILLVFAACAKKATTPVKEVAPPPAIEQPAPPTAPPAPPAVEKKEIVLQDIFFDFDRYNIKDEYKSVLSRNAELLLANPDKNILVEGHCDERGTNEYNMALGEKRAKAVVEFYKSYGIPADRISWISYGEERPFALGHNEEAWAQNRRAHMVVK